MAASSKIKKDPINLLRGWPAQNLLPTTLVRHAAQHALSDPSISTPGLSYGPDAGYEPLRKNIADWLTSFYCPSTSLPPIGPERICITGGASQNLGCMLSVYTDPEYTRAIWLVAPAYFLAFRIFEDAGFGVGEGGGKKMRAVPEDEEGVDIGYLRTEMEKVEREAQAVRRKNKRDDTPRYKPQRTRAKVFKHVIYCVPTFSNPSSRTMSLRRRQELVRLAREFDALVVCDDVYDFLQWPANPSGANMKAMKTAHLPRLVDIDRTLDGGAGREGADGFGNACSNGTLSKIAGPGIRVGWVEGTAKFAYGVSQTGTTCSGGAPSQLTSTYISLLLDEGGSKLTLQDYLRDTLLPAYARRYGILMNAIETHLIPLGFTLPQPERDVIGGYFAWLTLPSDLKMDAKTLVRKCLEEENVVIAGGNLFEVPGDNDKEGTKFDRNVRFCWAWEEESMLEEAMRRVAEVVTRVMEDDGRTGSEEYVVVGKDEGGSLVDEFK